MKLEQILRILIQFKTVTVDQKQNEECLRWIQRAVKNLPVYTKFIFKNSFPSLVITTKKTKSPIVWLVAHIDVVPGSSRVFMPKKQGDRLLGRGTFDMKFAAACYIKLLQELGDELSKYNLGVMLTTDEEVGGKNGVKALLGQGYRSKLAFLPDGGQDWQIEKAAKGVLQLNVIARGTSAHGSRTWIGKNAIVSLIDFLDMVRNIFPKEPCGNDLHWHSTCNVGTIAGGKAINQIPDLASAQLDIRFPTAKEGSLILQKIQRLQRKSPAIRVSIREHEGSYTQNLSLPAVQQFSRIAKEKYGITTSFCFSHGTSDGRFFARKNIPVIMVRPSGGDHHSENEWIDLKNLERFYGVLKDFIGQISYKS